MSYNLVMQSEESTVLSEYIPVVQNRTSYQSEEALENEFVDILVKQGYLVFAPTCEQDLIDNLREKLEALNHYKFSNTEWNRFFHDVIANKQEGIAEKTAKIQNGDSAQELVTDDGSVKNIILINKKNVHHNCVQVMRQFEVEGKYNNRYDVTVLVNGLPLVHTELKRRGVPIREAFNQIDRYQRDSFWAGSGLFEYVQIFVISNGTETKYYANTTRWNITHNGSRVKSQSNFDFTSYWADAKNTPIPDLVDFARTFFAKPVLLNILTKYCVFTSEQNLMVMRPYQIAATEKILERININFNQPPEKQSKLGGYIWHHTGSGKTLTSFKTAQLASMRPDIDKVLFVVDRQDLDYQTMKEYDKFAKGCANGNTKTKVLQEQLEDASSLKKIIITTIQKLSCFIKKNASHPVYGKRVVLIFDECHRSQFGEMHKAIVQHFRNCQLFGFTGTPIFAKNAIGQYTTEALFGPKLHHYTIADAIRDKNVLKFKVDFVNTMKEDSTIADEQVVDINRDSAWMADERISNVVDYVIAHFDQKTCRRQHAYNLNRTVNIADVLRGQEGKKESHAVVGFNSIFCCDSIPLAQKYYTAFKARTRDNFKIALIYSFEPNEEVSTVINEAEDGSVDNLDRSSRDFLEDALRDYNRIFGTSYDTSADKFQNYYKDVSMRMKNREIDMLIVVSMFLTGFDAPCCNTLWCDKNLKMHGLIQAFSRTNRVFNDIKAAGNIVCFRPLKTQLNEAIALFGDANTRSVVLLKPFKEYDDEYRGLVDEITTRYPIGRRFMDEKEEKSFIQLFSALLRVRNILLVFDEFSDILSDADLQDYMSVYQDLKDQWKRMSSSSESVDIQNDIVFETELLEQISIDISYILEMVKQYKGLLNDDKELTIRIQKAIDSSPLLRSKKKLIETFLKGIVDVEDIEGQWIKFLAEEKEKALTGIVVKYRLNETLLRDFIEDAIEKDGMSFDGPQFDAILPKISLFDKIRGDTKQAIQDALAEFWEIFYC